MLDPTVFHPRMARWKEPFGAVAPGTQVRFTVGRCAKATSCALCLHEEFSGKREEVPMLPCAEGWRITYTAPAQAELVWYFFRFSFENGGTDDYGTEGLRNAVSSVRKNIAYRESFHLPSDSLSGVCDEYEAKLS